MYIEDFQISSMIICITKELNHVRIVLLLNGYISSNIHKIINRHFQTKGTTNQQAFIDLVWIHGITDHIGRILRKQCIKTIFLLTSIWAENSCWSDSRDEHEFVYYFPYFLKEKKKRSKYSNVLLIIVITTLTHFLVFENFSFALQ